MKKTKLLSLVLVATMVCTLLSGCMASIDMATINKDGGGTTTARDGWTEDGLKQYLKSAGQTATPAEFAASNGMTKFSYDGTTFYGEEVTTTCKDTKEMETALNIGMENPEVSGFRLTKNGSDITLKLVIAEDIAKRQAESGDMAAVTGDLTEKEFAEFLDTMVMVQEIKFPANVKQIAGNKEGVTITGDNVKLDLVKMSKNITTATVYEFTTGNEGPSITVIPGDPNAKPGEIDFDDVKKTDWFYYSVKHMAEGEMVKGIGGNKFNPQGTLTYSEVCQIITKGRLAETGELNGHWAGKAVKYCVDNGWVKSLGKDTKAYDVPINREEAITAIFNASDVKDLIPDNNYKSDHIPDYNSISKEYQKDVLKAYNFSVANGVDDSGRFNPKGLLTRAEVCQIFVNLHWDHPIQMTQDIQYKT